MTKDENHSDLRRLLMTAEGVLSNTFGSPIQLEQPKVLTGDDSKNRLVRAHVKRALADTPNSVIIKQAAPNSYDPNVTHAFSTQGLFNEWAGLEFLSGLPDAATRQYGPTFYGGHRELGFVIMEDLRPHKHPFRWAGSEYRFDASLLQPLFIKTAREAETSLVSLMQCLGRMHAATVDRTAEYERIRQRLVPGNVSARTGLAQLIRHFAKTFPTHGQQIQLLPAAQFYEELESVADALENPGPFLAYIHGDPSPGNYVDSGGELRLIDFEQSNLYHALLDATFGRMGFPTCWCCRRVPAPVVQAMERAYRAELVKGCLAATNETLFQRGLAEACVFWTIWSMHDLPSILQKDQDWGLATRRQRILARLAMMINTADEFNYFPAIARTSVALRQRLCILWPDTADLPVYPAFRDMPSDNGPRAGAG